MASMNKQVISSRQAICIITVYICGSSVVLGGFTDAEQDSWLSLLLAQIIVMPVLIIYARIMKLYPEKNIYEIINILFGRVIGKAITILFTWYAIHLAALVLRNFSEFIEIVAMPETPQLPLMISMILVTVYLARNGIQILGKWSVIVLPIIVLIMFLTIALLLGAMDFSNILPIMNHSTKVIFSGAYQIFTFPFAETVLFLAVADSVNKKDNPYKIYSCGVAFGALILLFVLFRNIEAIGPVLMKSEYFPSYIAARIINVSDFLVRIEGSISINFIFGGITKITLCLLAASKGLASLFNIQDYKKVLLPVSLSALALCSILYTSTIEMINFLKIYSIYVIPFQIIIPVLVWIGAEIRTRIEKNSIQNPS
jgi:spore germination protein KB